MDIEIRLKLEEFNELLKIRDFWSEVIFTEGSEVAPGSDPFDDNW